MQGYIKLHREILEHYLWQGERFSKGQAWIDLLLMVNHKDKKVMVNNKLEVVKRGSCITSIRKLSDRWGWHHHTVESFLKLLESDNMIERITTPISTRISIVNYEKYQGFTDIEDEYISTPNDTQDAHPLAHPLAHSLATNKNVKNIIKENNISTNVDILKESECVKKFVSPTLEEVKTYFNEKNFISSPEDFYYHYESVNWYRGKTKISNWKNAAVQWEGHNNKKIQPFKGLKVATEENFNKTIGVYPKQVTDLNKARISWANAIRRYGDDMETLKAIASAIIKYKKECKANDTEERYIKSFNSFLDDSIEYYMKEGV